MVTGCIAPDNLAVKSFDELVTKKDELANIVATLRPSWWWLLWLKQPGAGLDSSQLATLW